MFCPFLENREEEKMINKLVAKIKETKAPIVVGLDPMLNYIPEHVQKKAFAEFGETLEGAAEAIWQFNKEIVDKTYDLIPAVKPQIAMYEQFGVPGIEAFKKTVDYCKSKDLVVIGDIKRGDIGSTSAAYAVGHLGSVKVGSKEYVPFDEDFATVNPYLGSDGVNPFIDVCKEHKKGLFILVIVCVIALWWFIRNAILYGGDFLGRQASSASAELYARYQYKPSHSKTFQKKGGSMLHMIFYKPSFLEHDWLVTVLYSFVGAFGYNKIYLSTMIIVPYLCCLLVGLILMRNCCQRDFFFWNADGTQTALTGKTKRKWSKLGWFTWANVFALLIPNYLNAYYSYSSDFQPQGRYSMPMLIPLMYFVTKGVQAFLKREKKLQKYEKLFCILVCVAAAALAAFTWARIIYPMYLQNYYGLR